MKYVVVGGAGAMGRITVRDLVETVKADDQIVIADYDIKKARLLADSYNDSRVSAVFVDVKNVAETAKTLHGAFAVINGAQYQLNLLVMEAALAAKIHYLDLGGLFHVTRQQLELDDRFKRIGRTALIGMGAAPGITNVLSRFAADQLDTVREIHTRIGSMDKTKYLPKPALAVSYSLKTILEEFSFEPAVFTKGEFKFITPMSGDTPHRFPAPVGIRRPMFTIHSEVATLPFSFKNKGVQEVSFKIAFDAEFVDRVRFLRDLGLASHDLIQIGEVQVAPIDVVNRVAMSQPVAKQVGALRQHEVVRAIVKGTKKGKKVTIVADCHTSGMPKWGVGLDVNTGSPPAIAAQMLAAGEITETGAIPAELAVPPEPFFKHLKKRRMVVKCKTFSGWSFRS